MERWILTPGGLAPLVLPEATRDGGCRVTEQRTPPPPWRVTWATRPEGGTPTAREVENREITLKLLLERPGDDWWAVTHDFGHPAAEAEGDGDVPGWTGNVRRASPDGSPIPPMVSDITAAMTAVYRDGGTLTRVMDSGDRITFDVHSVADQAGPTWDSDYFVADRTTVELAFTCAPFGRGRERLLGEGTLTDTDAQRFLTVGGLQVSGDVPALARLEYAGATVPQRSLLYAIDQPSAATATTGVQISLNDLIAPEGSAGYDDAGAYNFFQARVQALSSPAWRTLSLLRRKADEQPLAIAGTHRVFARVRCTASASNSTNPTGESFRARLRWVAGAREGGLSSNPEVTVPAGPWALIDLGLVYVPDDLGSVDGVLEVAGPVVGVIRGDLLLLVPTDRSAIASASLTPAVAGIPTSVDPLTGTGAVGGSAAQLGGGWTAFGPGPAWTRTASGAKKTATTADPNAAATSASAVALPISTLAGTVSSGAPAVAGSDAYVTYGLIVGNAAGIASILTGGTAGWAVAAEISRIDGREYLALIGIGNGTTTTASRNAYPPSSQERPYLDIRTDGTAVTSFSGQPPTALALPGGAPASGIYAGFFNGPIALPAASQTVTVRDFSVASAVAPDAVLFPGKTATVTTARATRTTAADMSGEMSAYRGDRPMLPPSGRAGRPVRVVMGISGGDFSDGREPQTRAAFTGRVFATPRYLQIPDQNA
jgi:hypothetical protein